MDREWAIRCQAYVESSHVAIERDREGWRFRTDLSKQAGYHRLRG